MPRISFTQRGLCMHVCVCMRGRLFCLTPGVTIFVFLDFPEFSWTKAFARFTERHQLLLQGGRETHHKKLHLRVVHFSPRATSGKLSMLTLPHSVHFHHYISFIYIYIFPSFLIIFFPLLCIFYHISHPAAFLQNTKSPTNVKNGKVF